MQTIVGPEAPEARTAMNRATNTRKVTTMKMIPAAVLISFCLSIARVACAANQPNNSLPPDGSWTGVFQPQQFTRMTFRLPRDWATSDSSQIELRLEPLVETRGFGMGGPVGVVLAAVRFDPDTGAFTLVPDATARGILGAEVPAFTGVYDRTHGVIGGKVSGRLDNPWFVLAPDAVAQRVFLPKLERAAQRRMSNGGILGAVGSKFGLGGKSEDKLRQWAQQFVAEYPDTDAYRTQVGQIQPKLRNLFQDASFKPYFGKPFDQLAPGELGGFQQTIQKVPAPRSNFPEERANGVLKAAEHSFVYQPSPLMASGITLSVLSMRAVDGWRGAMLQQMKTSEPTAASWQLFQAAESTAKDVLADDWPNRRDEFAAAVADARARTATPLFESGISEFLASEEARNPARVRDTLDMLAKQPASTNGKQPGIELTLDVLANNSSPQARDAQIARLTAALSSASQNRCAADRVEVRALPTGLAGLDAVNEKYREMYALYSTLPGGPAGCAAIADLSEVRAALLAESESELAARITRSANSGDVNAIASRYLTSSLDGGAAGARLVAAAEQRNEELRAAQAAALEKEKQRITALCGLNIDGLTYATDVQLICAGEFASVGFGRESEETAALVSGYLGAFADSCKAALPANKVEITEQVCIREAWTERGGWEVAGSRHCVEHETRGTGKYADPEVLNLANQLQQTQEGALMGDFFGNLAKALNDPIGFTAGKVRPVLNGRNDMLRLLSVNGCASKPSKLFQRNLLNFGSGRAASTQ